MIKYICNLCKEEISKFDLITVKTQVEDKITTAHLHVKCADKIKNTCKKYLTAQQTAELTKPDMTVEPAVTAGEHGTIAAPSANFKLIMDSFGESLPQQQPRRGNIITTQRMLLCIYKGMTLTHISRKLDISYQSVYNCKLKYSAKQVAQYHQLPERMDKKTVDIIDKFIEYGDVVKVSYELGIGVDKIKDILTYYTGIESSYY